MTEIRPYLRLLWLGLLVLIPVGFGLYFLRYLGLQQSLETHNHPWMKRQSWIVYRLPEDRCSLEELKNLRAQNSNDILWVDVRLEKDEWIVYCSPRPAFELTRDGKQLTTLKDLVAQFNHDAFILNVQARDISGTPRLLEILEPWKNKNNLALASPSQNLIWDLRKARPQWLFGADPATWTKLKLLEALRIETVTNLWPDFFVASLDHRSANFASQRSTREIHRRGKIVIVEWNGEQVPAYLDGISKGVLTKRPKIESLDVLLKSPVAN